MGRFFLAQLPYVLQQQSSKREQESLYSLDFALA